VRKIQQRNENRKGKTKGVKERKQKKMRGNKDDETS
jgi:hypothetical protein